MKKILMIGLVSLLLVSCGKVDDDNGKADSVSNEIIKSGTVIPYALWDVEMVKGKVEELNLNTVNVAVRILVDNEKSNDMEIHQGDLKLSNELIDELKPLGVKIILEPFPWIAEGSIGETEWSPEDKTGTSC